MCGACCGKQKKFKKECLEEHNRLREMHDCPPLKLDAKLSKYARNWAKSLSKGDNLQYRIPKLHGENIYYTRYKNVPGTEPVRFWYNEIVNYDYGIQKFQCGTQGFTQVLWKNSCLLGIGIAKKKEQIWVVCNYSPTGNIPGQYAANVPTRSCDDDD
ncbi:Golgi-associated plant pathogenesis-related protein 1-like [Teleopsis dalmanni]|uniref:Golgi-associated plant pathogenesis-related protein 1-like n=1 Tax=Teleopsis dalmanni TaxID=139649 RepID=UPI000D32A1FF|nr:Golgi-associated plant pathogenesis-related protein 1-like [Teleopsis dalmanni]XP_037936278.1 Golgi-associated plant pathogenesis-related protein 1-like [Teleopsis dalmanni]